MFMKVISTEDFPKNYLGGTSSRSLQMRTMPVSESYPAIRLGDSPIFLPKLGSKFSRTKSFCCENYNFYSHIGLGMCEGVGEDSRHGFGHVDIRVGS